MTLADDLIAPLLRDAAELADRGFATRVDIDVAMRLGAGHPRGPFEPGPDSQFAPVLTPLADQADPPERVAVIGTGVMAAGIAEVCARAGSRTTVIGRRGAAAQSAVARVAGRLGRAVESGKLEPQDRDSTLARISPAGDLSAAASVDLVIEAVTERLDVKRQLFADLALAAPRALLATNTSSFRVREIMADVPQSERVVALHFFNPAPAMRLVEVVGTATTDPGGLAQAVIWGHGLGKVTVSCGDEPGFIVNRLLVPYLNAAVGLCLKGAVAWAEADEQVRAELGHPMGPFELMDLIGLDVMLFALETLHQGISGDRFRPAPTMHDLVAQGRLGRKSGAGFYEYERQH